MVREGDKTDFSVKEAESLYFRNRLCVPYDKELEEAGASNSNFSVKEAASLYFQNRLCVPYDKELKKKLLFEAHNMVFTMHPRGKKMYQDLKQHYWWK